VAQLLFAVSVLVSYRSQTLASQRIRLGSPRRFDRRSTAHVVPLFPRVLASPESSGFSAHAAPLK